MRLTCPTCGREFDVARKEEAPLRPFCSLRCKMVDLGRWLDGTYNISEPLPEDQEKRDPGGRDDLTD